MRDELREILEDLKRGIRAEKSMEINTGNYIEDAIYAIEQWHIRERKKWAMGLLGKEKNIIPPGYEQAPIFRERRIIDEHRGYNQCRAETLKKIGEG